jgi:hypothetical protein
MKSQLAFVEPLNEYEAIVVGLFCQPLPPEIGSCHVLHVLISPVGPTRFRYVQLLAPWTRYQTEGRSMGVEEAIGVDPGGMLAL